MFLSCLSTGTTWIQEIVTLMSKRGDPHLSQTVPNWARAPWLEQHYCAAVLEASSNTPRIITTHLPHHLLGPALLGSKTKVKFTCFTTIYATAWFSLQYRDYDIVALWHLIGHLREQKSQRCSGVFLSLPQNGQLPPAGGLVSRVFKSIPGRQM